MKWFPVSQEPPLGFLDEDYVEEARLLVWIKGDSELHKGGVRKRSTGVLRWYADGHIGNFDIAYWAFMPSPPDISP